jgi:hypothetical protein
MYEQSTIEAVNKEAFGRVQQGLRQVFAPSYAGEFLRQVQKSGFRVRDFEAVLQKGLLGTGARADYPLLPESDQAQVREMYLRLVEQVAPELRKKFLKVYTLY